MSLTGVLQQSMRENKEKQALSDLMIKPVQRIPRYELLVKVGDSGVVPLPSAFLLVSFWVQSHGHPLPGAGCHP